MAINVKFDYLTKETEFDLSKHQEEITRIHKMIEDRTGEGAEYLGWLHYPTNHDEDEVEKMIEKANQLRRDYDVFVVCGIGGSYLGPRASIEILNGLFSKDKMKIVYLGNTLDPNYIYEAIEFLKDKKFCVCCISKSGTTTETSISFRILKELAEKKYGKEGAKDAIVAITDKEKGALRTLSDNEGYTTFVLPGDIGGRFSVMTSVGLFPMAVAGINIKDFIEGLRTGEKEYGEQDLEMNAAYRYALERHLLYKKGYSVELVASYEQRLSLLIGWMKQLFDESEGKDGKSLYMEGATFTTDLHSLGQFVQDGSKIMFETILYVNNPTNDVEIPFDSDNLDQLNYIAGKKLSYVNSKAHEGTLAAHAFEGNVPNIRIEVDEMNAKTLGEIYYFFMKACAMSAYLNGVNPFNQPGVEVYKKNMFHLLGKKGY